MNELLKIEPRTEGSDEMVLVVPPELTEKLKNAQFFPECRSGEMTYHVVTLGLPIDTSEPDDIPTEEIQVYIKNNAGWYKDPVDNGVPFADIYPDYPFPFRDFPAPINEHIARTEIRKEREREREMEEFEGFPDLYENETLIELEHASKKEAIMFSKSFADAVCFDPSLVHYTDEKFFEKEKAVIQQLATKCNLPEWRIIFYLKVYDKFYEMAQI